MRGHRTEEMAARERRSLSTLSVKKAKLSAREVDDVKESKGDVHLCDEAVYLQFATDSEDFHGNTTASSKRKE